jgi:hypothetical protein
MACKDFHSATRLQSEILKKGMSLVLALLKGMRVSLRKASRRLSSKCTFLDSGVRTYTQ